MIYLDYSATTPVNSEVIDTYSRVCKEFIGNPNSLHRLGVEAKKLISVMQDKENEIAAIEKEIDKNSEEYNAKKLSLDNYKQKTIINLHKILAILPKVLYN